VDDMTARIAAAIDEVGPRLKRVRTQRGATLTAVAAATGISKSTLSRLETGQRRASLELLLPLALAYRVPLDDLVGAPEIGDPRIRLRPRRVKGGPSSRSPAARRACRPGRS
jgi:transcriptional regulator with XRE-family HTH domain